MRRLSFTCICAIVGCLWLDIRPRSDKGERGECGRNPVMGFPMRCRNAVEFWLLLWTNWVEKFGHASTPSLIRLQGQRSNPMTLAFPFRRLSAQQAPWWWWMSRMTSSPAPSPYPTARPSKMEKKWGQFWTRTKFREDMTHVAFHFPLGSGANQPTPGLCGIRLRLLHLGLAPREPHLFHRQRHAKEVPSHQSGTYCGLAIVLNECLLMDVWCRWKLRKTQSCTTLWSLMDILSSSKNCGPGTASKIPGEPRSTKI